MGQKIGNNCERNLSTAAGATGGNPEAGRQRNAEVRHSLRAGPVCSAGGVAGSAEAWDPTFSEHSHGFRPGHSARQAVHEAQQYIAEGHGWVVDLDLEKFFDRVNHDRLLAAVAERVADKRISS